MYRSESVWAEQQVVWSGGEGAAGNGPERGANKGLDAVPGRELGWGVEGEGPNVQ